MKYHIIVTNFLDRIKVDERNTEEDACLKARQLSTFCPDVQIEVRRAVPQLNSTQLHLVATYRNSVRL